ncbi:HEAT repeat domain-containing protein [Planctomycetota bacterium]
MSEEEIKEEPQKPSGDQTPAPEKKLLRSRKFWLWVVTPSCLGLLCLMWLLYNWLGLWLVRIHEKTDFADTPCQWLGENLPLMMVGKGLVRDRGATARSWMASHDNAASFLLKFILEGEHSKFAIRAAGMLEQVKSNRKHLVSVLIKSLEEHQNRAAVMALGSLEKDALPSVPALLKNVQNEKTPEDVRREICLALVKMQPDSSDAVRVLVEVIRNSEFSLYIYASIALKSIARGPNEALPALLESFRQDDSFEVFQPPAEGELREQFLENETDLEAIRYIEEGFTYTINFSQVIANALSEIGPADTACVPVLQKALVLQEIANLDAVIGALMRIGPGAKSAIPALADLVPEKKVNIYLLAHAMRAIDKTSVTRLVKYLEHEDRELRYRGIDAIEGFGEDAAPIVPELIQALDNSSGFVRNNAADTLGKIGSAAKSAIPALVEKRKDPDDNLAGAVCYALTKIACNDEKVIEIFIKDLESPERLSRHAAYDLRDMGPKARMAIPALVKALTHSNYLTREHAAGTLAEIADANVVFDLEKCLKTEKSKDVKEALEKAIAKLKFKRP